MNNFPIEEKSSRGPVLGTIIIVILIIIGGIYIITSRPSGEVTPTDQNNLGGGEPAPTSATPDNSQAAVAGISAVETDLNTSETDLQNLDKELQ